MNRTDGSCQPYAHSRPGEPIATWEPLADHLNAVADLARKFADEFESGHWGYLAGLWHDLGKYRPEFQRRIRGSQEQVTHASVGAALAAQRRLEALAFVIAGHHAGLANVSDSIDGGPQPLRASVADGRAILAELSESVPKGFTEAGGPVPPVHLTAGATERAEVMRRHDMWIRFLFSALVDADRLATEAFYEPEKRAGLAGFDSIAVLRQRLDERLARFQADSDVNRLRARVLEDCRAAAAQEPGLFSLSVPTGGGKTLSALAFALRHAELHGLRRVIVVAPFTSIIEQNAAVYRMALEPRNVIEHHSALDESARRREDPVLEVRRRLAAENWDAPVVVTTAVQFFESLFASHPSRCRKLHNVGRSVIVLDEAQTVPTDYLLCVLDVLRELVRGYGCSIVLSTATQPALGRREALPAGLTDVREIVKEPDELAQALRRVEVRWPALGAPPKPYSAVAEEMIAYPLVLAIVHRRRDAAALASMLPPEGRFHLSTWMCAAHRAAELDQIRAALSSKGICRVVSTQLVEAGVDVDFPVVYRAMAGLDSLAQAAGRCNRNGLLSDEFGGRAMGRVCVFEAETPPPQGVLSRGLDIARSMLAARGGALDLADQSAMEEYFRRLYHLTPLDPKGVMPLREQLSFATVAKLVRLVDDGGQHPLVVPWGEGPERLQAFVRAPARDTARALQPYLVQVREPHLRALERLGALEAIDGFGYVLLAGFHHLYHPKLGLMIDESAAADPVALMC